MFARRRCLLLAVLMLLHAAVEYSHAQSESRSGSSATVQHIQGCAEYHGDSRCDKCNPGHQLADGRCKRKLSIPQSTGGDKPGPCYRMCGTVRPLTVSTTAAILVLLLTAFALYSTAKTADLSQHSDDLPDLSNSVNCSVPILGLPK